MKITRFSALDSMLDVVAALLLAACAALPQEALAADPAPGHEATLLAAAGTANIAYPVKASTNGRYLVDQNNRPFLMVGDSPQALVGRLSLPEAAHYMNNRARYGINALWINLLCNGGTACNRDGRTFDDIAPFNVDGDLSTPNPIYFERADEMIRLAAANGMVVLLDPIETSGWLGILRANGLAKAREYGAFLGNRYRSFANIIWMHGNDFQTWRDPTDTGLVQAVAIGIRSADREHVHTVELNYLMSGSLDDPSWAPLIELDAAYTYYPTYGQLLKEYNRKTIRPIFTVEANYEFERNPGTDGGSLPNLRRQEYWTMLSGATGQLYGSAFTWQFAPNWQSNLDTPGVRQLSMMKSLFAGRRWYDLVPDQEHATVTGGYGRFSPRGNISTDSYVTAARTPDGALVMAYLPSARTLTLDMTKLQGKVVARWYDPTNGSYRNVDGSPFVTFGSRQFAPPARNSAGDDDWVLVLEAAAVADGHTN
jgi:Protein of unknown function (DUF4038)/Putative collagen-binding domain of a collagenase